MSMHCARCTVAGTDALGASHAEPVPLGNRRKLIVRLMLTADGLAPYFAVASDAVPSLSRLELHPSFTTFAVHFD